MSSVKHRKAPHVEHTAPLLQRGHKYYPSFVEIARTLQGSIGRSTLQPLGQSVVIKIANRKLCSLSLGVANGRQISVRENIFDEANILHFLTKQPQCPRSIVKYIGFYDSKNSHHLIMEDGGYGLFGFVQKAHGLIKSGILMVREWQRMIALIFKQMLEAIEFAHSKGVCHFDISLENFVINGVMVQPFRDETGRDLIRFCSDKCQVKLCDFGLAVYFPKTSSSESFKSTKFVGKARYWSPEVTAKMTFDAKKNDIWCLGVCLFMMATGTAPFHTASPSDNMFCVLMNGGMDRMLRKWKLGDRVSAPLHKVLSAIFQLEDHRATISQLKEFEWLG